MQDDAGVLAAWAASGAMALTGPADGAPSPAPAWLAAAMDAAAEDVAKETGRWGRAVSVDGPALLGERAALTGMGRNGSTSVGGLCRFVAAADGWVALNLARPEDVAALPALVSAAVAPDDWPTIAKGLRALTCDAIQAQASLLGIPVGVARSRPPLVSPARELRRGGERGLTARPLVVDLSSLWAGPLVGDLLGRAGARVVKVEGRGRADGSRRGSAAFFDLLNAEKECVEIDFAARDDQQFLRELMGSADLVIEGSRPRALAAIGIDPVELVDQGVNWLSITGHGRTGDAGDRVGFGDDAAVEGGLFISNGVGSAPFFVADAAADPLVGLVGAALSAEMLGCTRAAIVEVPLSRAASWAARQGPDHNVERAGDGWRVQIGDQWEVVSPPRHRAVPRPAPAVGAHNVSIRAEFGSPG